MTLTQAAQPVTTASTISSAFGTDSLENILFLPPPSSSLLNNLWGEKIKGKQILFSSCKDSSRRKNSSRGEGKSLLWDNKFLVVVKRFGLLKGMNRSGRMEKSKNYNLILLFEIRSVRLPLM